MQRYDYLRAIAPDSGDALAVCTGWGAREWWALRPSDGNLKTRTLGLVSSIAAGLALALPRRKVIAIDGDGAFQREKRHPGTPCGLAMCRDGKHMMLAHGHAGKIIKLDLEGNVLGATGGQGKGPNRYGEAHFLALDRKEDIYVADTLNWRVQKLVKVSRRVT